MRVAPAGYQIPAQYWL